MNIQPYIINEIEIPETTSKIGDLQSILDQVSYTHIPVQNKGIYVGSMSENDIHSFDASKTVEHYHYALEGFFARESDNWLDVLHAFSRNQCNIIPVLDEENKYLGYVELHDIMNLFTETPFLNNPGGILIVEKGYKDYSFSEICQIVESNGAHVLGAFLSNIEDDLAQITVKTGITPINTLLQTFRRYGYKVISSHQEDSYSADLKDRSRYLDKYLNI
ncbi:CBS domain-containing protein [Salinimicrobium flavum]|uniref:CBS domain-containing protein n=1 Tax=Salinimicrobium flavum TaxID=1737065 RepID=A0ABW5IXY7_9FLAO